MTAPTMASAVLSRDTWAAQPFVTRLRRTIQLVDFLVVLTTLVVALVLDWGAGAPFPEDGPREFLAASLMILWPVMLWQRQSTATAILGQGMEEYRRVVLASAWTGTLVAALAYVSDNPRARMFLVGSMLLGIGMLLVERHVMRLRLNRYMAAGHPLHRVYVVAPTVRAEEIRRTVAGADARFRIVGDWALSQDRDTDPELVVAHAVAVGADTIVYSPLGTKDSQWTRRLGWAMEDSDLSLLVSPSLVEVAGPRLSVEPIEGLTLVRVDMPKFSGPARVGKRGVDLVGAILGLLVLGLPMLVIGWLVRRDSPGPAIFKQTRAGMRSETFECWKFRTMHASADTQRAALRAAQEAGEGQAATFKMADDPRITKLGRWLRKYSIDELPQLVNVLKGEMSLVGPRPHPLDDVERYDDVATRRLLAKPGMTGLWQVSGRSDLDWEQAVRLDLYYVENWSLASDLLILLRTVKVVLAGSGAY